MKRGKELIIEGSQEIHSQKKFSPIVYVWRSIHLVIGLFYTLATLYIWYAGIFDNVTRWTWYAFGAIAFEAVILLLSGKKCPLGKVHEKYGDSKTMFELVAGKTYAKYGMKIWWSFIVVGFLVVLWRVFY